MKHIQTLGWLVLVGLVGLSGLGGLGACGTPAADDAAPVETVRAFVAAWEDHDTTRILELIEPADWRMQIGPEVRAYTGQIETLAFVDPSYTLLENDGSTARVRVQAHVEYALRGQAPGAFDLDVVVILVNLDGQWYLRNVELGNEGQPFS